jgi:hypothetical protein
LKTQDQLTTQHEVSVAYPPGEYEGNDDRYEINCNVCEYIGSTATLEQGEAVARLHEAFVAVLIEAWSS